MTDLRLRTDLLLTASVVEIDRGYFVAHSLVFPVAATSARTKHAALKKLRDAIMLLLRKSAEDATVTTLLDESGYPVDLIGFKNILLCPLIYDTVNVGLRIRTPLVHRTRRRTAIGEERNMDAA
jgi:hypothetical protein